MKRILTIIAVLLLATALSGQESRPNYYRYIGGSYGFTAPSAGRSNGLNFYSLEYAEFNYFGFGLKGGLDISDVTNSGSQLVGMPLKGVFRCNIPWFISYSLFDAVFDELIYQSDSLGEALAIACFGCLVSIMPKNLEIGIGATPSLTSVSDYGGRNGNTADSNFYLKKGLGCSVDAYMRLTAQIWRIGCFVDAEFNYYLSDNIYYYSSSYDRRKDFWKLRFGLNMAF